MDSSHRPAIRDIASAAHAGDRRAAEELLPLVYDELRRLAEAKLSRLPPGNTLQATALVHEAYLKLIGTSDPGWQGLGHFFGAAAEAMRQLLVDQARRKNRVKHGGEKKRIELETIDVPFVSPAEDVLAVNAALERMRADDPRKADILTLRCFGGLSREEAAAALGLSLSTVDREWRYIVARLHQELTSTEKPS